MIDFWLYYVKYTRLFCSFSLLITVLWHVRCELNLNCFYLPLTRLFPLIPFRLQKGTIDWFNQYGIFIVEII
jgi:hypothetical protein